MTAYPYLVRSCYHGDTNKKHSGADAPEPLKDLLDTKVS